MPGSSISSSDALRLTPPHTLTPRAAAAVARGASGTRVGRGAAWLLARAALLLVVAALPVGFNAWIDPARLVAPRSAEQEIARVLAAGQNVTDFANYDDRAIEKFVAPMRRERPDVLVLGSSRMQVLRAARCAVRDARCGPFVNGAMQGAVLDDLLGVYGLYDTPERRPRRVLLGVDPWMESASGEGWRSVANERAAVARRAGIRLSPLREQVALYARSVRSLATPEYFRLSLHSFRRYGTRGIAWRVTDRELNVEKTKLPDGSVVWSDLPADNAERAAMRFASTGLAHDGRFHDLVRRAPGRAGALERFVRYVGSEGVTVTVVLVPFPAAVYDASRRTSGDSLAIVEREVHAMATRAGAHVVGSYDPRRAGVTTRDFFDEDHLRPEALARIVGN